MIRDSQEPLTGCVFNIQERDYPMGLTPALAEEQVADLGKIMTSYGLRAKIGG